MKQAITSGVFALSFVSLLVLGLVSRVQARDCSNASITGPYGFSCEGTLVGAPGSGALVCGGFPSLATAGTGDVLTGVVGSFLAKGMEARLAAAAASVAHTQAAVTAPHKAGLIAGDLLDTLPRVLDA